MGYFHSLQAFIHMGGYADYVWSAYAIVLVTLLLHFVSARVSYRRTLQQLRRKYASS